MARTSDDQSMTSPVKEEHNDADYYVPVNRRLVVAFALALSMFLSALDSTIVAVALPKIGSDFNNFEETSWVVTAYILTYTAFLPVVSKLTDIIGRKVILISSILWFMAFSGACGGAKSMIELIVFRALQGIGGAAIYSGVLTTISTMVPREDVAKYTSMLGASYALSSVAGPLIGGAIVSHIHWGWIFYINLPTGLIAAVMIQLFLTYPKQTKINFTEVRNRVDWIGAFLLLAASLLLCLSLQIGGTPGYPWVSATVLAPICVSAVLIPIFLWVETKVKEPVLPLSLFQFRFKPEAASTHVLKLDSDAAKNYVPPQNPNFSVMIAYTLGLGAAFFSINVDLPQRLQVVDSRSPIRAGISMLPILVPVGVISPLAAILIVKTRSYRLLLWVSGALAPIGAGLISTLNGGADVIGGARTSYPHLYGYEIILGLSLGMTITISTIIIQMSVKPQSVGIATGFQAFARTLGGLIGLAVSTAVLNARVDSKLQSAFPDSHTRELIVEGPTAVIPSLSPQLQAEVRQAYNSGYSLVFIIIAVWFSAGILATVGMKHVMPPPAAKDAPANEKPIALQDVEARDHASIHATD
ncbi:MFS general substrate transporter [Heliocybe sulcata]|uniref:MFS general substrate transporter n=1 Tax=Heliocybe sulcata TaxID=5364 RepID=A0A5C3MXE1_9AGAM|nr:MFS general substrate transporter [Heliocybe sulcata]